MIRYGPGTVPGKTKSPELLVTVFRSTFVSVAINVTDAAGTTASDASRTFPRTTAVLACGHAVTAVSSKRTRPLAKAITDYPPDELRKLRAKFSGSVVEKRKHCKSIPLSDDISGLWIGRALAENGSRVMKGFGGGYGTATITISGKI